MDQNLGTSEFKNVWKKIFGKLATECENVKKKRFFQKKSEVSLKSLRFQKPRNLAGCSLESHQNHIRITLESRQNLIRITLESHQNHIRITLESHQKLTHMDQNLGTSGFKKCAKVLSGSQQQDVRMSEKKSVLQKQNREFSKILEILECTECGRMLIRITLESPGLQIFNGRTVAATIDIQ